MADENLNGKDGTQTGADATTTFLDSWNLADEDKGFIQNSKYENPAAVVKALREAKSFIGADKNTIIKIPKADAEGKVDYSEVYKHLGRPEKVEDYKVPETDFAKKIAPKLFELGISQSQLDGLNTFIEDYNKQVGVSHQEEFQKTFDKEMETLKKDWGSDFEVNKELAAKAVRDVAKATGMTTEDFDKLESSIGTLKAQKLFFAIGSKTGDVKDLSNYNAGQETPEMAEYKIKQMQSDPEVIKKLSAKDANTVKEMNRLTEIQMSKYKRA